MRVLILNHQHEHCGVYQFAKRIYDIVKYSPVTEYVHSVVTSAEEYNEALRKHNPKYIIYNWHPDRMPWLTVERVRKLIRHVHCFIYHDGTVFKQYDKYLFFGDLDPQKKACHPRKRIILPRPIFEYNGEYKQNSVPTIGSFGFAFSHKKFHELISLVNNTFSEAIINLHLTSPYFGDSPGSKFADIVKICQESNTNPNVKLNITSSFVSDEELLNFLAGNDINVFSYKTDMKNPGLSSAIDYALSVKRPIAISNNVMFRHILKPEILLEKNSLQDIINRGTSPLEEYYVKWSNNQLITQCDQLFV